MTTVSIQTDAGKDVELTGEVKWDPGCSWGNPGWMVGSVEAHFVDSGRKRRIARPSCRLIDLLIEGEQDCLANGGYEG